MAQHQANVEQGDGEGLAGTGTGYDPLFWLPEQGMSVAELSSAEKNRLSHRGRALQALVEALGQGPGAR